MNDFPKCVSCKKKFNLSSYRVNRTPLLLSCGHTFCQHCIAKWTKDKPSLTCPLCRCETICKYGIESVKHLWPSMYHVGIIKCLEDGVVDPLKADLPNMRPSHMSRSSITVSDIQRPNCSECVTAKAAVRCVQCQVDMCKICYSAVHHSNWKLLRQHYSVPLRESLLTTECKQHHRLLEFYCEDHQCSLCPECMLLSSHRDHKITRMVDKYENLSQELRVMTCQSNTALMYSAEVKSSIAVEIENAELRMHHKAYNLHQRFQYYIGILQARFCSLLQNLKSSCREECDKLSLLLTEIEKLEKPVREALDDAELMLSKETRRQMVIDPVKLIAAMKSCENLPFELEITESDASIIKDRNHNPVPEEMLDENRKFDSQEEELYLATEEKIAKGLRMIDDVSVYNNNEHKLHLIKDCPGLIEIELEKSNDDAMLEETEDAESDQAQLCQLQKPPAKHQELVVVTSVISPSHFFVQRCVDQVYINTIERALQVYGRRKPLVDEVLKTVNLGDYCAAVFLSSHFWCRAQIVQLFPTYGDSSDDNNHIGSRNTAGPNNFVEVEFIDFGNKARMQISCLRRLPSKLRNIPALALPCSLNNIRAMNTEGWTEKENSFFLKMVGNHPLLMTTFRKQDERHIVDLHKPGVADIDLDLPTSVRDAMLFLDMGKLTVEQPLASVQTLGYRSYLTPGVLDVSTFENVYLSHMQSPKRFFVQLADSNMTYLMHLLHEIQQWVHDSYEQDEYVIHRHSVLCPYKDMVCLAKYASDGNWYRAKVLAVKGSRMVHVLFVDYGNEDILHFSCLLKIPDMFLKLPMQALACSLSGVHPPNDDKGFSESCLKRFYELCGMEQMLMEIRAVKEGVYHVDLFDYADEDPSLPSVSDRLFRERLVAYENMEEVGTEMGTAPHESLASEVKQECKEGIAEALLTSTENFSDTEVNVKCKVISVVSPFKFHVQTESQMNDLNKMMISLQEDMDNDLKSDEEKKSFSEGNLCAIYSLSERRWCRGSVVSITENQECLIKLLDYGWEEQVPVECLRVLPNKYEGFAGFTAVCSLAGVHPAGDTINWTATAINAFKNMVSGKECNLQILKSEDNTLSDFLPVDLMLREEDKNKGAECFVTATSLLKLQGLALSRSKKSSSEKSCATIFDSNVSTAENEEAQTNVCSGFDVEGTDKDSAVDPNSNDENVSTAAYGEESQMNVCSGFDLERSDKDNAVLHTKNENYNVEAKLISRGGECLQRCFAPCTPLPVEEYIPCTVSYIESSNCGYIRRVVIQQTGLNAANEPLLIWEKEILSVQKHAENELSPPETDLNAANEPLFIWEKEIHRVQKHAENELSPLEINQLKTGLPCLCWYVNDEEWHRAIIVSCDHARQTAVVRYVDYGTLEKVPLSRLKRIPDALLDIPKQAYRCKIHDMPDLGDESDIVRDILLQIEEKDLMAYIRPEDDSETEQHTEADSDDRPLTIYLYLVESDGKLTNIADKVTKFL